MFAKTSRTYICNKPTIANTHGSVALPRKILTLTVRVLGVVSVGREKSPGGASYYGQHERSRNIGVYIGARSGRAFTGERIVVERNRVSPAAAPGVDTH